MVNDDTVNVVPNTHLHDNSVQHIHADFDPISFEDNVKDADLVAELEIQELITEMEEPSPQSIFKANVLNIFYRANMKILK